MGRGVALQASQRYPGLALKIGQAVKLRGNRLHMMGSLCTFPVKHEWHQKADKALIVQSARQLQILADACQKEIGPWRFVLPRPGCGNGGLTWDEVRPLIEDILPDNVHVITNGE